MCCELRVTCFGVRVAGCDLSSLGDRALSRFRGSTIGFVFQAYHLLDHLTVAENVSLPSLRVGPELARLPGLTSTVRKSGLTMAPEVATDRLRSVYPEPMKTWSQSEAEVLAEPALAGR